MNFQCRHPPPTLNGLTNVALSDVIPNPSAGPPSVPTAFDSYQDVRKAKEFLRELDSEAKDLKTAPQRCKHAASDVAKLLDARGLTRLQFSQSKYPHPPRDTTKSVPKKNAKLGAFADLVMKSADTPFRYLTPEQSPERRVVTSKTEGHDLSKSTPISRSDHINSTGAFHDGLTTPSADSPQSRKLQGVVSVALPPAQRAEYQYTPDASRKSTSKRSPPKRRESGRTETRQQQSFDQRQQGDLAVQGLQGFLQDLFEAEDQLQPDTSGVSSAGASGYFATGEDAGASSCKLRSEAQCRLEVLVHKTVSLGRLGDVEVERLSRAQKLCESSIASLESLPLQIEAHWSDDDVKKWLQRVALAEDGLAATRTMMRIMIGGAQHRELQSEDFLRQVLEALSTVVETFVLPIVEEPALSREKIRGEKEAPPPNPKFLIASTNRKLLQALLTGVSKTVRYLGDLLVKTDFDETAISSVEHICKALIFAENATTEKDSAFGTQNFETTRRHAMDVFAKIFTKYIEQRQYILDEILISLEKLPSGKQSARQFRLADSKPIQLVSALLMRLIQTSATYSKSTFENRAIIGESNDMHGTHSDNSSEQMAHGQDVEEASLVQATSAKSLISIVKPLQQAAQANASYVVKVLIQRALATSKSSDEPYRKLLDIFTEDFLCVLGSSDWPAAELLLRTLIMHMIGIVENQKSSGPSRVLALEILGVMGSGILGMQIGARSAAASLASDEEHVLAPRLVEMVERLDNGSMDAQDVLSLEGPYRISIEHLNTRGAEEDAHLHSARGYTLMQWASCVLEASEDSCRVEPGDDDMTDGLSTQLKHMLLDPAWMTEQEFPRVSSNEGRLATRVVILNSRLCKAFGRIFNLLLASMGSEQPTVRSRSLKSVFSLLEKDPSIIDRSSFVLSHIFRCASDPSSLVRDSALGLIAKCVSLRPKLDAEVCPRVIGRTKDAAVGVRKRAMRILKDVYLRNQSTPVRSAIASAILARTEDTEESVVEIARATMEEIWFQPLHGLKFDGEGAPEAKMVFASQAALFIESVERDEDLPLVLESLVARMLMTSKAAKENSQVCRLLIATFFDGVIDNNDLPGSPPQDAILRSLTIFSRACPALFTGVQLERLEPYTQNLTKSDELEVFRSVVTILRHVLPHLSVVKKEFLLSTQTTLLKNVPKLFKAELREVAPCLWTMNKMLGNVDRLVSFMSSVIQGLANLRQDNLANGAVMNKARRLMTLAGEFGNACDFSRLLEKFRGKDKRGFAWYTGDSVPGLIVDVLCSYTSPKRALELRRTALDAICTVAQAWPQQFLRADVVNALEAVFKDRTAELEEVLIAGFECFFIAQEVPDDKADVPALGTGVATGTERLSRTYVASDQDGASTSMAQRFLKDVLRIALSSDSQVAHSAARLVVSINKQGLVHPKESGPALVALETCADKIVANQAFNEHKSQHQKHESLFDKEYMRAVQAAFEYQATVANSFTGFTGSPPMSKLYLCWEVLKGGRAQVRKKFMGNIAAKMTFHPSKLDVTAEIPTHLAFVRFCVENLAFFDYDKIDDILNLLNGLEKTFAGIGSGVAQAIESEVLKIHVGSMAGAQSAANTPPEALAANPQPLTVEPIRLRQLAVSTQILNLIWETRVFLRRLWNVQKHLAKPAKQGSKDTNKTLSRVSTAVVLEEAYASTINDIVVPARDPAQQRALCSAFVELMAVDNEVKVAPGEEDDDLELDAVGLGATANGAEAETPSEVRSVNSPSAPLSASAERARKRKVGPAGVSATPVKKKGKAAARVVLYESDGDDEPAVF